MSMRQGVFFDDVSVGTDIPVVSKGPLTTAHVVRWSAAMENWAPIHYDWRYVTTEEGYPDLVVNGRLQALLVFELARAHASTPMRSMSSRNVRPLFVNRPFTVCGEPSADNRTAKLWVADQDGAPTLVADADFE